MKNLNPLANRRLKCPSARTLYNQVGLALYAVKTVADFRKHAGHDEHSQRCDCFAQCLPCMTEALAGKRADAARARASGV